MKQKYDAYETAFAVGTKLALPAPTACSTAPAVKSSSARCQLVNVESRCPCDARRWPRMTLVIAMLSSVCYVAAAQGTWSTARLSVVRNVLAATSVGNVAIFAGGKCCCWCLFCW